MCVHLFAFSVCLVFWICLAVLYSPGGSCFFMFVSMVAWRHRNDEGSLTRRKIQERFGVFAWAERTAYLGRNKSFFSFFTFWMASVCPLRATVLRPSIPSFLYTVYCVCHFKRIVLSPHLSRGPRGVPSLPSKYASWGSKEIICRWFRLSKEELIIYGALCLWNIRGRIQVSSRLRVVFAFVVR